MPAWNARGPQCIGDRYSDRNSGAAVAKHLANEFARIGFIINDQDLDALQMMIVFQ